MCVIGTDHTYTDFNVEKKAKAKKCIRIVFRTLGIPSSLVPKFYLLSFTPSIVSLSILYRLNSVASVCAVLSEKFASNGTTHNTTMLHQAYGSIDSSIKRKDWLVYCLKVVA